jgi:hypothetical protein
MAIQSFSGWIHVNPIILHQNHCIACQAVILVAHPCRADKTLHVAAARGPMPGQTKLKAAGQPLLPPPHHVSTRRQRVEYTRLRCVDKVQNATGVSTRQMQAATASAFENLCSGQRRLRSCSPSCTRCPMTRLQGLHIVCMLSEAKILSVIRPDHSTVNKLIT